MTDDERRAYKRDWMRRWRASQPKRTEKQEKRWRSNRRWRAAHPGYATEYTRKWRALHPDLERAAVERRQEKIRKARRAYLAKLRRAGVCYACGGPVPKEKSSRRLPVGCAEPHMALKKIV